MKNSFLIASYSTKDTPYEKVMEDYLLDSIDKLKEKISYTISSVPDLGNWHKNTEFKPKFLLNMLNENKMYDAVVFLDADARVKKYPKLFEEIPKEYDIAAHFLDWKTWYGHSNGIMELLSGTLFLRNSNKVKKLVEHWYKKASTGNQWEQKALAFVLKFHPEIKVYNLPIEYCYINTLPNGDKPRVKVDSPVIVHYQVSRELKRRR